MKKPYSVTKNIEQQRHILFDDKWAFNNVFLFQVLAS